MENAEGNGKAPLFADGTVNNEFSPPHALAEQLISPFVRVGFSFIS